MKIALCGSAPSSTALAPFRDASFDRYLGAKPAPQYPPSQFIEDDWEIWGCSPGFFSIVQRANRWFEVHRWEPGQAWFSPEYCQFLREFRGPVYTGGPIPEIRNHVVYPIARVESTFSAYFLTSSLSLMMAIAILDIEQVRIAREAADPGLLPLHVDVGELSKHHEDDVIGMFGVDMAANEEWNEQKDGCLFFILEALRRGISFFTPPESCLLRPRPIYGLSEWDHAYIKCTARMRELNQRLSAARQQADESARTAATMGGAIDNLNYFINTWISPYGIPAGVMVKIEPGTGLGGGTTMQRPPDNVAMQMNVPASVAKLPAVPQAPAEHIDENSTVPKGKRKRK